MKIKFDAEFNKCLEGIGLSDNAREKLNEMVRWGSDVEAEFCKFTFEDLAKIYEVATEKDNRSVKLQINSYLNVMNNNDAKIKNLPLLEEGIRRIS